MRGKLSCIVPRMDDCNSRLQCRQKHILTSVHSRSAHNVAPMSQICSAVSPSSSPPGSCPWMEGILLVGTSERFGLAGRSRGFEPDGEGSFGTRDTSMVSDTVNYDCRRHSQCPSILRPKRTPTPTPVKHRSLGIKRQTCPHKHYRHPPSVSGPSPYPILRRCVCPPTGGVPRAASSASRIGRTVAR